MCPVFLFLRIAPMQPAVFHGGGSSFLSNAGVAAPFETGEQFFMVETGDAAPTKCVRIHWCVSHVYCVTYFSGFYALIACLLFFIAFSYRRSFKQIVLVFRTTLPFVMLIRHRRRGKVRTFERYYHFCHTIRILNFTRIAKNNQTTNA